MQRILQTAPQELAAFGYADLALVSETEDFLLYRAFSPSGRCVLIKVPASGRPSAGILGQLEHELQIARDLSPEFAVTPLEIERSTGRMRLILEDCRSPPLTEFMEALLEIETFLRIATGIAAALAAVHGTRLVHKDVKPANIFATAAG